MTEPLTRDQMCWRVAHDFDEGDIVNLGVGMPLNVLNHTPEDHEIIYHSENGILGMKPLAEGQAPRSQPNQCRQATGRSITGAAPISTTPDSFAMIRGHHIDVCVLGAYEISEKGDLANWRLPKSKAAPAVGGAMDLVYGAKRVFALAEHNAKDGAPKIVENCSLPLTGVQCVDRIFTDIAVIDVTDDGLVAREMVEGLEFDELQARTRRANPPCQRLAHPFPPPTCPRGISWPNQIPAGQLPPGPEASFREGLAAGEFRIQKCGDCDSHIFYPRAMCPECGSMNVVTLARLRQRHGLFDQCRSRPARPRR